MHACIHAYIHTYIHVLAFPYTIISRCDSVSGTISHSLICSHPLLLPSLSFFLYRYSRQERASGGRVCCRKALPPSLPREAGVLLASCLHTPTIIPPYSYYHTSSILAYIQYHTSIIVSYIQHHTCTCTSPSSTDTSTPSTTQIHLE
jgi:hypothetical protein